MDEILTSMKGETCAATGKVLSNGVKRFLGPRSFVVYAQNGEVIASKIGQSQNVMVLCPSECVLMVGTDAEIAAEKAVQDAKYAPIKAQLEAAKTGK